MGKIQLKPQSKAFLGLKTRGIFVLSSVLLAGIFAVMQTASTVETVSGYAYIDYNGDEVENGRDYRQPVLTVNVYSDEDNSGTLSQGDKILASGLTDEWGRYSIEIDYLTTSWSRRVASGDDDVEERTADGDMYISSSDLEMVYDGSRKQRIGIRYDSVMLPPAAVFSSIQLQFEAKNSSPSGNTLQIYGEKAAFSEPFADEAYDLSSRTKTDASVTWNTGAWSAGNDYQTPDLTPIVEEIMSVPGWVPGNPISFIIEGNSGTKNAYSGTTRGPELQASYLLPQTNYIVAIDSACLQSGSQFSTHAMVRGSAKNIPLSYQGQSILCYAISDVDPNPLYFINRISGANGTPSNGGKTFANNIETVAFDFASGILYSANANRLGKVDLQTGQYTACPSAFGTAGGSLGEINLGDVDGMAFDPFSGQLYGVHRRNGSKDILFLVDTLTGQHRAESFGPGVDYVVIDGPDLQNDVDDLAISPVDGKLYAINNGGGVYDYLIEIDDQTGQAVVLDTVAYKNTWLPDIEGASFTNYGSFMGSTGSSSKDMADNSLFEIDLNTGAAKKVRTFNGGGDYEGCGCLTAAPNVLEGHVFLDANNNQNFDGGETVFELAKLRIYVDENDNGQVDSGERLVDSLLTNSNGHYRWATGSNLNFVIEFEPNSVSTTYVLTTLAEEDADFSTTFGDMYDLGNDFGLIDPTSLPVEWASFSGSWENRDAVLKWETVSERNSDHFVVERSIDGKFFENLAEVAAVGYSDQHQQYSFIDHAVGYRPYPQLYYRLRQVDQDGGFDYSPTVVLSLVDQEGFLQLSAYPNPTAGMVNIRYLSSVVKTKEIRITNLQGQVLFQQMVEGKRGEIRIDASTWNPGLYLAVLSGEKEQVQQKLVVR